MNVLARAAVFMQASETDTFFQGHVVPPGYLALGAIFLYGLTGKSDKAERMRVGKGSAGMHLTTGLLLCEMVGVFILLMIGSLVAVDYLTASEDISLYDACQMV